MSRPPSSKDASAFKTALDFYESKNYKNALVEVDKILKRSPTFADALCLKALTVYHLDRKDEAGPLVLEATKYAGDSAVAWHMAGIYYKLVKKYSDAFKMFSKSFRLNPDNVSVLHDLSMIAMQERQFGTLVEVRRHMLADRPSMHLVWFNMAVAQYVAADPSGAVKTLELFEKLLLNEAKVPQSKRTRQMEIVSDIEVSEVIMLKNRCIEATGDFEAALKDLLANEDKVLDKLAWQEKHAHCLQALGRTDQATQAYRDLIKRNPDNADYYDALEKSLGISDSVRERAVLHRTLAKKYPRAELPKLRPLSFLEGDALADHLHAYIENKLARGVPSCFAFVKQVYKSSPEVARSVGDSIAALPLPESAELKAVRAIFVGRHYSYTGRHAEALEVIETALLESSDHAELALAYSKVLARQGDFKTAAQVLEEAAKKDPGDRFMNAKAAKYALKANDVVKSVEIASIFPIAGLHTKDGIRHLTELQSVNYLAPLAAAYSRVADHGMALKRAEGVASVFDVYTIDQYDFHYYGPRRGTVRAYLDLIEWEDSLYCHPRYLEAAQVGIYEYIALASKEDDGLSDEIRAKRKAKRAKLLKKWEDEPPFIPKGFEEAETRDTDPFGREFLDKRTPLDEALRLWAPLQDARPTDPTTWTLAFEIYLAQKKHVLAVQSLKKCKELGASESYIAYAAARARYQLENDSSALEVIRVLQLKMLPSIAPADIETADLLTFVDTHVKDRLLWAKARHDLGALDGVEEALAKDEDVLSNIASCTEAALLLAKWRLDGQTLAKAVKARWPRASFL